MYNLFSKKYILILVLIILVGLIIWQSPYFLKITKKKQSEVLNQNNKNEEELLKSKTWQDIPKDIEVPETNTQNLPENVAKPRNVSPVGSISDSSIRNFEKLIIENDKFNPNTFYVYQGDVFDVFLVAIDKDYDWTQPDYGYTVKISKGEAKRVQLQATASGKFMFYCASCGGPDKGPIGYLIVAPKK